MTMGCSGSGGLFPSFAANIIIRDEPKSLRLLNASEMTAILFIVNL